MKKFLLMMVMMITMSANVLADGGINTNGIDKYELRINHNKLANYLNVSKDKMEMYDEAISELENDMAFASTMTNEESSIKIAANAIRKNIKNMYYILNREQYRKYLMLLNLTLEHRGFDMTRF